MIQWLYIHPVILVGTSIHDPSNLTNNQYTNTSHVLVVLGSPGWQAPVECRPGQGPGPRSRCCQTNWRPSIEFVR